MKNIENFSFPIVISLLMFVAVFCLDAETKTMLNETGDSWEIEIIKKSTNEVVKTATVQTNSFLLSGLESGTEYFARVRTKNTFFSGWGISDVFTVGAATFENGIMSHALTFRTERGTLFISSNTTTKLDIFTVDGRLIRSLIAFQGETVVNGLESGIYLVNKHKIIVN